MNLKLHNFHNLEYFEPYGEWLAMAEEACMQDVIPDFHEVYIKSDIKDVPSNAIFVHKGRKMDIDQKNDNDNIRYTILNKSTIKDDESINIKIQQL